MNMPDREKVLWVCSDMYRPFQKSIGKAMPNARWAIDHFHVVMKANEAVDTIRRELQQGMSRKARINTKRGLAYTLKTRRCDLTTEEAMKIRLLRDDPTLAPTGRRIRSQGGLLRHLGREPLIQGQRDESIRPMGGRHTRRQTI